MGVCGLQPLCVELLEVDTLPMTRSPGRSCLVTSLMQMTLHLPTLSTLPSIFTIFPSVPPSFQKECVFRVLSGWVVSWRLPRSSAHIQWRTHTIWLQITDSSGKMLLLCPQLHKGRSFISLAAQVTSPCPVSGSTFGVFPWAQGQSCFPPGPLSWEALVAPSVCRQLLLQESHAGLTLFSAFAAF